MPWALKGVTSFPGTHPSKIQSIRGIFKIAFRVQGPPQRLTRENLPLESNKVEGRSAFGPRPQPAPYELDLLPLATEGLADPLALLGPLPFFYSASEHFPVSPAVQATRQYQNLGVSSVHHTPPRSCPASELPWPGTAKWPDPTPSGQTLQFLQNASKGVLGAVYLLLHVDFLFTKLFELGARCFPCSRCLLPFLCGGCFHFFSH